MKAVRVHRYGDASALCYEEAAKPQPQADEILLKVRAAGINPADCQFRAGQHRDYAPRPLPFIPGWDAAGIVEAVGARVTRFKPGEAVFAMSDMSRDGAYAEYLVLREREAAPAPRSIPLQQAAGVPLAALTAWSALFDVGSLQAGHSVLVHAAAGGVGLFAVQLARRAGARVIGTASASKHELLHELGVDTVVDYRSEDLASRVQDLDLVLDTVGGETRERSWPLLRKNGLMACIAMPPPDETIAHRYGLRCAMVAVRPDGARLAQIGQLIDAAELKVCIDREYPLSEAAAAHRYVEQRHARGKVILRVE